jgi:acetyl esterase/lipase
MLSATCAPGLASTRGTDQPQQPASGPGGSSYPHAAVTVSQFGSGATGYTIFEPASPTPASAPLVVFLHGYLAIDPSGYRAWIDHIVRRGNIVVYPAYQTILTLPGEFEDNAATAISSAISVLQGGGHVQPQLDRFAMTGHSMGGLLTANLGATAAARGLPQPKALFPNEPPFPIVPAQQQNYALIPSTALMVILVGDMDTVVGQDPGRRLWDQISQIPAANKDLVRLATDSHGAPPMLGDHSAPSASVGTADAVDFYGIWKVFDGLTDAAFYGTNRDYALGGTPEQRHMGVWSDGVPAAELRVLSAPDDTPAVYIPSTGVFFLAGTLFPGAADTAAQFGPVGAGWVPVRGDWDGDGTDSIGLYDPTTGAFFLRQANSPGPADVVVTFGAPGATPLVGDWDGDGDDTVGIYNPVTGVWFLRNTNSPGPADVTLVFGPAGAGWMPVPGDWDGDGDDTVGVFDPASSTFFYRNTNASGPAEGIVSFGPAGSGWTPLAGDWDQDGADSPGLHDPVGGVFWLRNVLSPGAADVIDAFGPPGATPLVGDWQMRCNCG